MLSNRAAIEAQELWVGLRHSSGNGGGDGWDDLSSGSGGALRILVRSSSSSTLGGFLYFLKAPLP